MMRKILVGLDDSAIATKVLSSASEIAERFDAELHLVHALDVPPEFPAAAANADPHDALPAHLAAQATAHLAALAKGNVRALRHPPIVIAGDPWHVIQQAGDRLGADLIVIGSHAFGWPDRILGSVAGHLANQGHINVLVVRPARDAAESKSS